MREVCFILAGDRILRWYVGTSSTIPDSRERWQAIWTHRDTITEIAHTHPGGLLRFSREDLTTMEAVEAGTGRDFTWSVVTADGYLSRVNGRDNIRTDAPWWLTLLRGASLFGKTNIMKGKEVNSCVY